MSRESDATHAIIIPPSNSTQWDFLCWMKVLALFLFLIPYGTIFRYFYEAPYTFGSIMLFDSDLTQKLVQGIHYKTSCFYSHSFYNHAISFLFQLFLRFLYLLVLYSWLFSIWLSYGSDNSTTMILRFTFDRRTISDHRLLLDIVFG